MKASSHALYTALTADLRDFLPNVDTLWNPSILGSVKYEGYTNGVKQFASIALVKSILKKFEDDSNGDADAKALGMFISMNDKCRDFRFDLFSLQPELQQVFSWAKTMLDDMLHTGPDQTFAPEYWLDKCDFGPGASVAASGSSFYHKTSSGKLSYTDPILYSLYIESIRTSKTWIKAEKLRRDSFGLPVLVSGNKLCFVPKNTEVSRTICTEPSLNMFIQKGLASNLEMLLRKSFGFDLSVQQFRNKRLAREGSRTGVFATIDLTSASDTISCEIVRHLFPSDFVAWLEVMRSPTTELPDGSSVGLHMISSMGNAFTFPLQTIIFSAIALACYKVCGIEYRRPNQYDDGNLGVFGDDIVVDSRVFDLMCRAVNAAGFLVNKSKSYNVGLFRESCGGDYFDGHYVRGVYCRTLKNTHGVYSLINRLNVWSANNRIPLPSSIRLLRASVKYIPVPPWESDIAGIKVPLSMADPLRDGNGSFLYKRLVARAIEFEVVDEPCKKMRANRVVYNPDGVMLSALKGSLRNGSLSIRQDVVRPHYRFGVAPCWDYIDLDHSLLENGDLEAWKQAVFSNLGWG